MRHYLPSLTDTKSVKPMDKKLTEIFLQCTLMELHKKGFDEFLKEHADEMGGPGAIFWHRLQMYGVQNPPKITVSVAIAVCCQIKTPGDAVLWAFTINRMFAIGGPVTMTALAEAFPIGFPDERGKEEIWDAQKIHNWGVESDDNDNMLDKPGLLTDTENPNHKKEWCKWLKT